MEKTKEQIELVIGEKIGKFLKEQIGEGEENVIIQITNETVLVRLKNALSPAEKHLMQDPEGAKLIKELKEKIIENVKPQLENIIKELTSTKVTNIYSNINTETGERIIMITVDENLEEKFKRNEK